MEAIEFNDVLKRRIEDLQETLSKKGQEYAGVDRLSNFKSAAALNNCTQAEALWGMVTKHIIALKDFVHLPHSTQTGRLQWDEKIGDIIAYMVLLDAIVTEELEEFDCDER